MLCCICLEGLSYSSLDLYAQKNRMSDFKRSLELVQTAVEYSLLSSIQLYELKKVSDN